MVRLGSLRSWYEPKCQPDRRRRRAAPGCSGSAGVLAGIKPGADEDVGVPGRSHPPLRDVAGMEPQ